MNFSRLIIRILLPILFIAVMSVSAVHAGTPRTVTAEKGGGEAWSHLKVRLGNITEFKTVDRSGWRNNGTGFTAKTSGEGQVPVNLEVSAKGNVTYEDYNVSVKVTYKPTGAVVFQKTERIPVSGGRRAYNYTWTPLDYPGSMAVSISITGGNPQTFTYFVEGTIDCERMPEGAVPPVRPVAKPKLGTSDCSFTGLKGQVELSRDDGKTWEFVSRSTPINWGDLIRTGEDSEAVIGFADMSVFKVRSESTICVMPPPNPSFPKVRLVLGNMWINVKKMLENGSVEAETNQAVCGIKGTTFELWETGRVSVVKVTEGVVSWRNKRTGKTVQVRAGQTWSATERELVSGDARTATGYWQSVGTGDCPGRDVSNSRGPNPDPAKCNDRFRGLTAVCWSGECTYKNIETAACTGGANPGRMYTCAGATGAGGRKPSGPEVEIFRNGNDQGVANGGRPPRFSLDRPALITRILCYHYNGGRGAEGGTISIHTETGKWIGSWPARAENHLHWVARPDVVLQPGRYIVVDSDPSTWSQNGGSSGEGHVIINGVFSK